MSDTFKDGRKGGGHKGGHWGKEYWKSRWHPMGEPCGRWIKTMTHRFERLMAKYGIRKELDHED